MSRERQKEIHHARQALPTNEHSLERVVRIALGLGADLAVDDATFERVRASLDVS